MQVRPLQYFLAVVAEGSFRRAAERLDIEQSAVSRRIHDLEAELGFLLFERGGKRATLTAAGQAFAEEAARIMGDLTAAEERARMIATGVQGKLTIGLWTVPARHPRVPESLAVLRAENPGIELNIVTLTGGTQVTQAIADGVIDIGHHLGLTPPDLGRFSSLLVGGEDWVLAVPATHRLASRRSLRAAELRDEDFIIFPRDHGVEVYDRLLDACAVAGLAPRIVHRVAGETTQLALAAAGLGVMFTFSSTKRHAPRSVAVLDLEDVRVPLSLWLVWRRDNKRPALLQYLAVTERLNRRVD